MAPKLSHRLIKGGCYLFHMPLHCTSFQSYWYELTLLQTAGSARSTRNGLVCSPNATQPSFVVSIR
jgi:hypothetical protein